MTDNIGWFRFLCLWRVTCNVLIGLLQFLVLRAMDSPRGWRARSCGARDFAAKSILINYGPDGPIRPGYYGGTHETCSHLLCSIAGGDSCDSSFRPKECEANRGL